ncbi:MAG: glycosyltransferase family 39 protein [Acidobacteria bacterium]|nr:glycosyltransferase family 39 protein [Acidobacteriota bacterium]
MKRYSAIAALLVVIATARIVSMYAPLSHTMDEPIHLGAGMEWLHRHTYAMETSHPPLARVMAAITATIGGARFVPADGALMEGLRVWGRDRHYDRMLAFSRAGILPLFWLACAVVFLWARRIAGGPAAVAAVITFTTIPPVLAHAGLVTTDMAATAFTALGALVSMLWAENPTRKRTVWFGIVLGLGVLAKFSVPIFLPAIWLLWLAWRRPAIAEFRARVVPALLALGIGCVVIWAGYLFTMRGFLPAPNFWQGLGLILKHNTDGHSSYILGQRHQFGVWYFFPVTLLVKTPLALLLLTAIAAWVRPKGTPGAPWSRRMAAPVLYAAAILLVAMSSNINIGVRHVLPLYVGISILAGALAAQLWKTRARTVIVALFAWQIVSGVIAQPDLISYTNEITRGHPENWVAESDLDWGQDMHRVADFLNRMGAKEVSFTPYSIYYLQYGHAFPKCTFSNWYHPAPGWNVVSLSGLKVFNHPGWVKGPPEYRIGRTHWAWYFPPE